MRRKLVFASIFLLILTGSTMFAQRKADNFLGKWKLETGNKWAEKWRIESMTIVVTEKNNELIVEKISKSSLNAFSNIDRINYKINGGMITTVIGGLSGGIETRRLRFVKDDRLQFLWSYQRDYQSNFDITSTRETWTIFADGKTLTVNNQTKYVSTKTIFTKE